MQEAEGDMRAGNGVEAAMEVGPVACETGDDAVSSCR